MQGVAILLAVSALGVDYGWEVRDDGQSEYIIQIEPSLVELLKAGESITSEVDPRVTNVRRFQVRIGTGSLPRELPSPVVAADPLGASTPEPLQEYAPGDQVPSLAPVEAEVPREGTFAGDPIVVREAQFNGPGDADGNREEGAGRESHDMPAESPDEMFRDVGRRENDNANQDRKVGFYGSRGLVEESSPSVAGREPPGSQEVDAASRRPAATERGIDRVTDPAPDQSATPRRWLPLSLSLLALFASVGLNVYLGWVTWDTYQRYHVLMAEMLNAPSRGATS